MFIVKIAFKAFRRAMSDCKLLLLSNAPKANPSYRSETSFPMCFWFYHVCKLPRILKFEHVGGSNTGWLASTAEFFGYTSPPRTPAPARPLACCQRASLTSRFRGAGQPPCIKINLLAIIGVILEVPCFKCVACTEKFPDRNCIIDF